MQSSTSATPNGATTRPDQFIAGAGNSDCFLDKGTGDDDGSRLIRESIGRGGGEHSRSSIRWKMASPV